MILYKYWDKNNFTLFKYAGRVVSWRAKRAYHRAWSGRAKWIVPYPPNGLLARPKHGPVRYLSCRAVLVLGHGPGHLPRANFLGLGTSIGSPCWFVRVGTLIVRAIESKPLASIEDAYCYLGKASQIVMMCRNAYYAYKRWLRTFIRSPWLI
jgi:hypothetical protein